MAFPLPPLLASSVGTGPYFVPHAPPPASAIDYVQLSTSLSSYDVTIPALAGLLARTQPRLAFTGGNALGANKDDGSYWLLDSQFGLARTGANGPLGYGITVTKITTTQALMKYGKAFPNLITFTSGNDIEASCAASIAGVADYLPVAVTDVAAVQNAIGSTAKVVASAVGMSYNQLWAQHGSKFPAAGIIYFNKKGNTHLDYSVFARALTFDQITDPNLGSGSPIFASFPRGTMVLGFWQLSGTGGGPVLNFPPINTGSPEGATIAYLSPFGFGMHANDRGVRNTSLTSGLPPVTAEIQHPLVRINYDKLGNTIYVCVTESQGDAWGYNCKNNWNDALQVAANGVPIGFPVANIMADLHPEVMSAWYYLENKANGLMHLYAGPGGIGYSHIQEMPGMPTNNTFAIDWYTNHVLPVMQALDQQEIFNIPDGTTKQNGAELLANAFPTGALNAIMSYQLQKAGVMCTGTNGALIYTTKNGTSLLVNSFADYGPSYTGTLASAIQAASSGCRFVEIMVNTSNDGTVPTDMAAAKTALGAKYVWVTIPQFIDLMRQAGIIHGGGGGKTTSIKLTIKQV
jgi:hypothetical protein